MLPPPYHLMSLDLNQDQNHDHLSSSSFSSPSSSSYPNPPNQVREEPSYYLETKHDHEEVEKTIPSSGSWNSSTPENHEITKSKHKLTIRWKKEETSTDGTHNIRADDDQEDGTSMKWMSSKMRIMKRMMASDPQTGDVKPVKFEDQQQQGTDNSSNNSNNNYSTHLSYNSPTIRVCSDCNTTKTPLWRSGPRGPKSLCNACGIRQRKARRAMALAAASENGTTIADHETCSAKRKKLQQKKKENKSKVEFECSPHMKKKRKLEAKKPSQISRNKFITFEDLRLSLSQNLAVQQVFPQDEKEAAILLMALSYGLVHG